MKNIITIVFYFISLISFGQSDDENQTVIFGRIGELTDEQLNNSGPSKLTFVSDSQEAKNLAVMDIENETPFLLLMGGIAPVLYLSIQNLNQNMVFIFMSLDVQDLTMMF